MPSKARPHDDAWLPHPAEPWYDRELGTKGGGLSHPWTPDPAKRRSYMRYVLCGNGGERFHHMREVADQDPAALAPWADHVARFGDKAIARLLETDWTGFWRACTGASDAAIDDLAARIARSPPREPRRHEMMADVKQARVELLIGSDSDHALMRLGELSRKHKAIREMCRLRGVVIPKGARSAGIRRYAMPQQLIASKARVANPKLRALVSPGKILVDPRGLRCRHQVFVALDADLALLPGKPLARAKARRAYLFSSMCDACEEHTTDYSWKPKGKKIAFDDEHRDECDSEVAPDPPGKAVRLRLVQRQQLKSQFDVIGALGGWPYWIQAFPSWPQCHGRPMFYVGHVYVFELGGVGNHSYSFVCECGAGVQTNQCT
ncbi:MAG: hypothetical protein IT370_24710 [Deltaproteobacteria bacterium]|nr:hypothetical protein [Deltaproteobacteria bacterium]